VQRRRGEIGVRMAVGALRVDVLRMIFAESLRIAAVGLGIGLPLSVGLAHLLRSQLYELNSFDLPTFTAAWGITLLVSVGSAFLPARSAARINPMDAIRSE
jgi:ABC-type antimicrobial peptide transport system permease subunit